MARYICRRLLQMIPVIIGVSIVIFSMLHFATGDPARRMLGPHATQDEVNALREELGLNDPFHIQYLKFISGLLRADFGRSYTSSLPVSEELLSRFPTTFTFAVTSTLIACLIGIPLGIISATKQYTFLDNFVTTFAMMGVSVPTFWMGLMLMMIFALHLYWLPASGFYGPKYWILPSVTIGIAAAAHVIRMTRSSMLEVIRQDYIRTARAKGQKESRVILDHALRNALMPILTTIGLIFGFGMSGQIVTEQIFSIPGLGKLMIDAVNERNYPIVRGGVLLICISYSMVNLIVDLLYAAVSPRIRALYEQKKI